MSFLNKIDNSTIHICHINMTSLCDAMQAQYGEIVIHMPYAIVNVDRAMFNFTLRDKTFNIRILYIGTMNERILLTCKAFNIKMTTISHKALSDFLIQFI